MKPQSTADVIISKCTEKTIVNYRHVVVEGKATSKEVMESMLNLTQAQITRYAERISRGQVLSSEEVKAVKDLGDLVLKMQPILEEQEMRKLALTTYSSPFSIASTDTTQILAAAYAVVTEGEEEDE